MSASHIPHDGNDKLVSVICRTVGRPTLATALDSLAHQNHPTLEVILVDAGGTNLEDKIPPDFLHQIKQVGSGTSLSRPEAANLGLESSTGEYLLFLDDDDWIAAEHISNLVTTLIDNTKVIVAYSSTVKVTEQGELTDLNFNQDYDPVLLMRDNYIPIHAALFRRSVLLQGCRFDPELEIYEDWDFWLQLAQLGNFLHIDVTSAFYREGGESGTGAATNDNRFSPDTPIGASRAKLYQKWKDRWSGEQLNALIGKSLAESTIQELHDEILRKDKAFDKVSKRLQSTEDKFLQLENQHAAEILARSSAEQFADRLNSEKAQSEHAFRNRLAELTMQLKQLEHAHALIEDSLFWRATYPLRQVRNWFHRPRKGAVSEARKPELESPDAQTSSELSVKAAYSIQAKQHLKEFLARAEPLALPDSNSPKVSILLVFFNQAHLSLLCLESIIEQASEVEVVIVDNYSTDETAQLLNLISGAKLIKNQDNLGFVKAVNQGAALASAEHILLLNNDTRLEQGAIEYANETLESGEDIGAVGGKILLLDGSLQEAGSLIWQDGSCLGYGRGEDPEQPEYMFRRDVDYCSGAFLLFRKQDFTALNGFDEEFAPAYYEESDFCVRLRKSGKRVVYDPRAIITHFEFASTGGINQACELQLAHRQLFFQKHSDFLSQFYDHTRHSPLQARSPTGLHNVLFIDDRVPYPSMGSGYPRSCHLLQTLLAMPARLTFYPLQFPDDDWQEIYAQIGMDFEVMLNHGRERLLEFLQSRIGFFDCIIISRDHNMDFFNQAVLLDPRIAQHTRIIYDAEALIAPRKIMHRRLLGETVSEAEAISAIKQEVHKARLADAVIAVSENEADYFRSYDNKTTVVAGHAIRPRRTGNVFASRKDLLFVGALREDDSPNVDSLMWFMKQCWPLIRTAEPETRLVVVGDNTAPALNEIDDKRIVFRGRQASIESFYDTCRVFIAPTRFAAGIPHKVHEAAANGLPSVVTPLLANQLTWSHDSELLVAESGEQFAEQCLRLYRSPELWAKLQEGGLRAVGRDCSEETFSQAIFSVVEQPAKPLES